MSRPKQSDPQFKLRLDKGLLDRISACARMNSRSVNSEIHVALEALFPPQRDAQAEIREFVYRAGPGGDDRETLIANINSLLTFERERLARRSPAELQINAGDKW